MLFRSVAAGAGTAAWLLPDLGNPWLTLLLRGGVLTLLYATGVLLTGVAPEALPLLAKLRKR